MSPDIKPVNYLIDRLEEALLESDSAARIARLEPMHLQTLRGIGGSSLVGATVGNEPEFDLTVVRSEHPPRARRHYVVAPISTKTMSDGDFVSIMERVVNLRVQLAESEQLEIWVILVAPAGAFGDRDWGAAERQYEANQAFARVVVWLPSTERATWEEGTEEVLRKLFLRGLRGLPDSAQGETTDLSPIDAVLGAALESAALRVAWRGILLDPDQAVTPSSRAERLVETYEKSVREDKPHE